MQLYAFEARPSLRPEIARATWGPLLAIAVAGTALYGATLPGSSALGLLAVTGPPWGLFGPALAWITRRRISTCAHACLVTMAYGVGILAVGAGINLLLGPGPRFILLWVGLSNGVMALALTRQLSTVGVRAWKTLGAWLLALDLPGLVLFLLLRGPR
jgi:hypothetical protein